MGRQVLLHAFGATYHVTSRGNNKQAIFFDEEDRIVFLDLLGNAVEKHECSIHAYCLMTNHVHLLIQVGAVPINRVMHNITSCYASWFNKKYQKVGHLFQGRYQAQSVETEQYAKRLVRYIHRNPIKAGMVAKAESYIWSSHSAYLGKGSVPWLSTQWIFLHFSLDMALALKRYKHFVGELDRKDTDDVVREINEKYKSGCRSLVRKSDELRYEMDGVSATLNSIISFSCTYFQTDLLTLKGGSRFAKVVKCRIVILWLAQDFRVATGVTVAHFLNRNACNLRKQKNSYAKKHELFLLKLRADYSQYLKEGESAD